MVGRARLQLHSLPAGPGPFVKSLGWQLSLLARWAEAGVQLAERIKPDLIRCHGNFLNGFAAASIKQRIGVPLVVSLHINPEEDLRRLYSWGREGLKRLALEFHGKIERTVLVAADVVICVYPYLVDYARQWGARRVEVIYNVVQQDRIVAKSDYRIQSPPRVVNVGRQVLRKILRLSSGRRPASPRSTSPLSAMGRSTGPSNRWPERSGLPQGRRSSPCWPTRRSVGVCLGLMSSCRRTNSGASARPCSRR